MTKIDFKDILGWEKKYRIRFINSISGYKSVHLVGTENSSGQTNLAIFNSIVHLGADPPLVGFVMRPVTVDRHTYSNIIETGYYTINHVHKSFLKQAHYTSASFQKEESEFEKCNLTEERLEHFAAPFVEESRIKLGLKLKEDILIKENGTRFIVGEIQHIIIDDEIIKQDGQLDLELAHDVCVTGLNQYSSVSKFKKLEAAYVETLPDFKVKERADSVVFDKTAQSYNSSLLPYGTNISAPRITETGITAWKNSSISNFNHTFTNKIESLKKNYQDLIDEYHLNEMVYGAKVNFEPIIGQVYHLYVGDNQDEKFLSLIPPKSWKKEHVGSFKLNHEKIWERLQD
ncbi:MAG TPA: DUF2452 domain-containing protein [Chryseolinea sp.]|nr:DUF2452 domain-containing protein [Chryseolinea sp.]